METEAVEEAAYAIVLAEDRFELRDNGDGGSHAG